MTTFNPYIPHNPGDLFEAEDWNQLQIAVQKDIALQIANAVAGMKKVVVDEAADADKLGGKTIDELTNEIVQKALSQIPKMTGYRMVFKRLEPTQDGTGFDRMKVIAHGLMAAPLADVYQLDYFRVLCATGDTKDDRSEGWVNFYLYHEINDRRIRAPEASATNPIFEIEPTDLQPDRVYKIPFKDLLYLYQVDYTDGTSLDELETDFWLAFFKSPNDTFENDQFCHSPWFEKCCGEKRTVAELKQHGDWDHIYFQMRPTKTINYPKPTEPNNPPYPLHPSPTQVFVTQFDFDRLGIALLTAPDYSKTVTDALTDTTKQPPLKDPKLQWLNVMVLLKV